VGRPRSTLRGYESLVLAEPGNSALALCPLISNYLVPVPDRLHMFGARQ
jgi:hypothetical protein